MCDTGSWNGSHGGSEFAINTAAGGWVSRG